MLRLGPYKLKQSFLIGQKSHEQDTSILRIVLSSSNFLDNLNYVSIMSQLTGLCSSYSSETLQRAALIAHVPVIISKLWFSVVESSHYTSRT